MPPLTCTIDSGIACVELSRPDAANAMDAAFWRALPHTMQALAERSDVRVVVLSGAGRHFCAGLDLSFFAQLQSPEDAEPARARLRLRAVVRALQRSIQSVADCPVPVLAAVHGACLGGGLDLIAACDVRYCTADAFFGIHEINLGLVADLGSLQRLPHLMSDGLFRELAYTGRRLKADEALAAGLITRVHADRAALMDGVRSVARDIAARSPLAVTGTKITLDRARGREIADGLEQVATWNAAMLSSADLTAGLTAQMAKTIPDYPELLPAFSLPEG